MAESSEGPDDRSPPRSQSLTRERTVGKYRLQAKLGQGGMSAVYLATVPGDDRQVALKLLSFALEDEPAFLQRFRREAALTRELDHPNIVKTLDFGEDPASGVYLVMEYVPGQTLRQRLDKGLPTLGQVADWVTQVASALDYAHQRGVVHRDIKPENLLLPDDDPSHIYVADFGVARVEEGTRLTRTGMMPGTPEYMSPELFGSELSSPASDVYSLALVVYEMLTGNSPFRSANVAQTIQRQAFETPKPASAARLSLEPRRLPQESLPPAVDAVLKRALEKDPQQRYRGVLDFGQALEEALLTPWTAVTGRLPGEDPPGSEVSSSPTMMVAWSPPRSPTPSRWWWLVPLTLMALALWVNFAPRSASPSEHFWIEEAVGWESVPLSGSLHGALVWHGLEVGLFCPTRGLSGPSRARTAAATLTSWLRADKLEASDDIRGQLIDGDYIISGPQELVRVTPEIAADLGAEPAQVGEYWLALMRDMILLRQGKPPRFLKGLERDRPLRLPSSEPRSPLLQHLYERARLLKRDGPLTTESMLESLLSLSTDERRLLVQAARHVPLAIPSKGKAAEKGKP